MVKGYLKTYLCDLGKERQNEALEQLKIIMQPIEKDDERAQLYTMATVDLLNTVNHGSGEEPIDFDDEEDKDEAQSHFKDDYSTEIHSSFI